MKLSTIENIGVPYYFMLMDLGLQMQMNKMFGKQLASKHNRLYTKFKQLNMNILINCREFSD